MSFGLLILLALSTQLHAAENVWQSTYGQGWFYEARSAKGEVVAGSWWESSLTPGTTYTMRFDVKSLRGKMALLLGGDSPITIDRAGSHSYDFHVAQGGKRRMLFRTLTSNVMASVSRISVTPQQQQSSSGGWQGGGGGGGGSTGGPAKGHYVSFDREHNLLTQMQNYIDKPGSAPSNYHLNFARNMHGALTTPGVKGVWMKIDWRHLEVGDGRYNWNLLDANINVAKRNGLKFIVQIGDRSFNGSNPMPNYFPGKYVLHSSGGGNSGKVSKRWDPWVYNRLIRLHKAIANRYANHAGFGGIASSETAMGRVSGYNVGAYKTALAQITNQTQAALRGGAKFFLYMNFLQGGDNSNMRHDARVALLRSVTQSKLVIGAPDVTPDAQGMPRSASAYRIHVRKTMPGVGQLCHFQHVDQGQGGKNVKDNRYRRQYLDEVKRVRSREQQSWFKGSKAVFEFDDLRDASGNPVELHPNHKLGKLWQPDELFQFAKRNFSCDYYFWHYREQTFKSGFRWPDIRPVILNNQHVK